MALIQSSPLALKLLLSAINLVMKIAKLLDKLVVGEGAGPLSTGICPSQVIPSIPGGSGGGAWKGHSPRERGMGEDLILVWKTKKRRIVYRWFRGFGVDVVVRTIDPPWISMTLITMDPDREWGRCH